MNKGALCKSLHLAWTDVDGELVSLVGDLKNLWPGETVNAELSTEDKKSACTDSNCYVTLFVLKHDHLKVTSTVDR